MSENNQTIKGNQKGRGGARKNAGRKKSAVTTKTREIADKVIEKSDGNSPLEVMLRVMEGLVEQAEVAKDSDDPDDRKSATKLMMLAANVAKDAAPYIHPRLSAIDHTTKGKEMGQLHGVLMAPGSVSEEDWESQGDGGA